MIESIFAISVALIADSIEILSFLLPIRIRTKD